MIKEKKKKQELGHPGQMKIFWFVLGRKQNTVTTDVSGCLKLQLFLNEKKKQKKKKELSLSYCKSFLQHRTNTFYCYCCLNISFCSALARRSIHCISLKIAEVYL